jgi:glycosyltransferase involved in cell wall biosynthesis
MVYVFAYACDPEAGSEPGTGWMWLAATLEHNDVRLFTDSHNPLERVRSRAQSLAGHLEIEVVSAGRIGNRIAIDGHLRHFRYVLWVLRAGIRARTLEASEAPTVAHHLTYATDWLPSPATWLKVTPFIWGPVGGATYPSLRLLSVLPARTIATEALRSASTRLIRRLLGWRTIRRARLAVAMNEDSGCLLRRLRGGQGQEVVVEPNVAIDTVALPSRQPRSGNVKTAVFAGRLVPCKALVLAIRALGHAPGWQLHIYGDGPDLRGLQLVAHRLGVADRLRFHGRVKRERVLDALASADAFLFPSLHDTNSWAVAEAVSMGLPVVCLDIGGPPVIAGPLSVPVATNRAVVRNLGIALAGLRERGAPDRRWDALRLPGILQEWHSIVKTSDACPGRTPWFAAL